MSTENRYNPGDPKKGDFVFVLPSSDWKAIVDASLAKSSQTIAENAAFIVDKINPDHKDGIFNYKIKIQRLNGKTAIVASQDCRCLHTIQSQAKRFAKEQTEIVEKLKKMVAKREDQGMSI